MNLSKMILALLIFYQGKQTGRISQKVAAIGLCAYIFFGNIFVGNGNNAQEFSLEHF